MMTRPGTLTAGLYALTPTDWPPARLLAAVDQLLGGGLALLQYRAKPRPDPALAAALLERCRRASVPLIINDDVELAAAIDADGVHLGRDDADPQSARARLGDAALIGVSCYSDLSRAEHAAAAGADYLAFGAIYPSPTKPEAVHCPLDVLGQARRFGLPVAAIGGIRADNAAEVVAAGADLLAVITDLFEAEDISERQRAFLSAFNWSLS